MNINFFESTSGLHKTLPLEATWEAVYYSSFYLLKLRQTLFHNIRHPQSLTVETFKSEFKGPTAKSSNALTSA
jgi:hypothetical protein